MIIFTSINHINSRDRTLLEQIYFEYRHMLFNVAYKVLKDPDLAEDTVHSVFVKLAFKAEKIDDIFSKKTKGFLVVITRNTAIDIYRKRKRASKIISENKFDLAQMAGNEYLPQEIIISNDTIDKLQSYIASLDSKYGDVLLLKYYNNLSNTDIADLMGLTVENVRVRLHRAKKMLADRIAEGESNDEKASNA